MTTVHPAAAQQAIGESEAFLSLQERISKAARASRPVILIGERGTGKELAAARLHMLSPRWSQPYVTLNCAALSPTLIESELFGHEAGAFTGAMRRRKGRFEMADGGSLFLDEVGNIPLPDQEKILRVVEYGQMERVGNSTPIQIDARLIAATNADLPAMAGEGRFRQDLLDRLSFEVIYLPPLRARQDDIMPLAEFFARRMASELGLERLPQFSGEARRELLAHPWPGNVRELKNVIERMVYRGGGEPIRRIVFDPFEAERDSAPPVIWKGAPLAISPSDEPPAGGPDLDQERLRLWDEHVAGTKKPGPPHQRNEDFLPLTEAVAQLELRRLREALAASRYNQRQAAERLGLTYHQFRGYYRKYRRQLAAEAHEAG